MGGIDTSRNNDLVVDVTIVYTCDGNTELSVQSVAKSFGQHMTCTTLDNVGYHTLNLAYFDRAAGTFLRDSSCSNGPPNEKNSCFAEASCVATNESCAARSGDFSVRQRLPIPRGTTYVVQSIVSPESAAVWTAEDHFLVGCFGSCF